VMLPIGGSDKLIVVCQGERSVAIAWAGCPNNLF
jgi:hypothetical protein